LPFVSSIPQLKGHVMPEPEIVISIRGGVVQEVYASGPLAELVVVDWDAASDDDATETLHRGVTLRAHVVHPIVVPLHRLAGSEIEAVIEAADAREARDRVA
jgi:hypothetical protein